MRPTRFAIASLSIILLNATATLAHDQAGGAGWVCSAQYPRYCTYEGPNPNARPIPDYDVRVFLGGNGTGYQDFHWQTGAGARHYPHGRHHHGRQ